MTPNIPYGMDESDMDVSIIKITNEEDVCAEHKSKIYDVPNADSISVIKIRTEFEDGPNEGIMDDKLKNVNGICDVDIYIYDDTLQQTSFFNNKIEAPIITIEKIDDKVTTPCKSSIKEPSKNNQRNVTSKKRDFLYECNECTNVQFKSIQLYMDHKKRHHAFPCNYCPSSFEKQATLKYHTIAKHGNFQDLMTEAQKNNLAEKREKKMTEKQKNRKNECSECHLMFWKIWDLEAHMEKVHYGQYEKRTETRHICRKCNKAYESQVSFLNHLDQHNFLLKFGCKELQCRECKSWFHKIIDLMIHIQKEHSNQGKFLLCPKDNKLFTDENSFRTHMENHNNNDNAVVHCPQCNSSFSKKSLLLKHLESHSEFRCSVCSQSFTSKIGLTIHSRTHKIEGRFKCGICKKEFLFQSEFKSHYETHANNNLHICTVCNQSYQGYSMLAAHARFHVEGKMFNCKKCDEKFDCLLGMLNHEKAHTTKCVKECKECNLTFLNKKDLDSHTKQHQKSRFDCNKCKMVFVGLKSYEEHKNSLCKAPWKIKRFKKKKESDDCSKLRPKLKFKCNKCNMVFIGLKSYRAHMKLRCGVPCEKSIEKILKFNCNKCGEKFRRVSEYVQHWKTHKGVENNCKADIAEENEKE